MIKIPLTVGESIGSWQVPETRLYTIKELREILMKANTITLLDELKKGLDREITEYLAAGGDAFGVLVACGFYMERVITSCPHKETKDTMLDVVHNKICLGDRHYGLKLKAKPSS